MIGHTMTKLYVSKPIDISKVMMGFLIEEDWQLKGKVLLQQTSMQLIL